MKNLNMIKPMLLSSAILMAGALPLNTAAAKPDENSSASTNGTAKVSATLPQFIILHYYSAIELNFDTPASETIDEGKNIMNVTWAGSVYDNDELKPEELKDAKLELDNDLVTVSLPNVWAIRGFAPNGKAKVSIEIPEGGDELKQQSSIIEMSSMNVTQGNNTGTSLDVELNGIAKSRATTGGVTMDLDFMKTTRSGEHSGGLYKITAETI